MEIKQVLVQVKIAIKKHEVGDCETNMNMFI